MLWLRLIMATFCTGLIVVFFTIKTMFVGGFSAEIIDHCIGYSSPLENIGYVRWVYLATIALPFFLSSKPFIHQIGVANLLMFCVAYFIYTEVYISIWCFFAAIVSVLIYFYFREQSHIKKTS
jgi:hypothetical protein